MSKEKHPWEFPSEDGKRFKVSGGSVHTIDGQLVCVSVEASMAEMVLRALEAHAEQQEHHRRSVPNPDTFGFPG